MAKSPKQPEIINCEDCRNFTGSSFSRRFGCGKGHAEENSYSFLRSSTCGDHAPLTRNELIFRRFKSWTAADLLKNKKTAVRRSATTINKALTEFRSVLSAPQQKALEDAASALRSLGKDIELAETLAVTHRLSEEKRHAAEEQARLDQIADSYFGIAGEAKVIEIVEDLIAFSGHVGKDWYKPLSGDREGYIPLCDQFSEPLRQYRKRPSADNLKAVRTAFARGLEELNNRSTPTFTANAATFEQFRAWYEDQKELERMIADDPTIVQLKPARRR